MVDRLKRCWAWLISERHILIRGTATVRHLRVPGWVPAATVLGACAAALVAVQLGTGYVEGRSILSFLQVEVALRQAEFEEAEHSNADLREHVAQLEQRLEAAKRELTDAQQRLAQAAEQNGELRGQLYTVELKLAALEEQRDEAQERLGAAEESFAAKSAELDEVAAAIETAARHGDTQRTVLVGRLKLVEAEKEEAARRVDEMKRALAAAEKKASVAFAERDRMKAQLAQLERDAPAEAALAAAPAEKASGWPEVEGLLASVGVDVAGLLAKFNLGTSGRGGPFLAIDPRAENGAGQVPLENLRKLLKSLPLAAPLEKFKLESRFGTRRDPFNRKRAMHAGLDFTAPFRTPVFATAPGKVVFAGAKREYGRTVEVDHGHGIVTRYAHLHRTSVVTGQRLSGREQIGQLGSSGRSSGPHLHYEILVNGVPQDPQRFLEAGRSAVKMTAAQD
jgi:murein DD-endopeptidase MepM/ murein hydrolase activator NlpD